MTRQLPPLFMGVTAVLHAAAVAFAGLGDEVSPPLANAARWLVAVIYTGSVIHLAVRGGAEWASLVLTAAPIALAVGLALGAAALAAGWGTRPGSPLVILTACALPAVVAALIAPALGAVVRRAVILERTDR